MELNQEANVQGEVGYETVTFDNNTSTRYSDWLHCANERVGGESLVYPPSFGGWHAGMG